MIMLFERPESMKTSKDLFVELRHMYRNYRGRRASGEDGMRAILETIAPELVGMDEANRKDLIRDIRAIYSEDDSVLGSFMHEPVVEYLCNKDNKIGGGHHNDALFVWPNFVLISPSRTLWLYRTRSPSRMDRSL